MIRETCSCGATFEMKPERTGYTSTVVDAAAKWRRDHKCVQPVTLTAVHDSGPGLADVIERLTTISEHVALIGRLVRASK